MGDQLGSPDAAYFFRVFSGSLVQIPQLYTANQIPHLCTEKKKCNKNIQRFNLNSGLEPDIGGIRAPNHEKMPFRSLRTSGGAPNRQVDVKE